MTILEAAMSLAIFVVGFAVGLELMDFLVRKFGTDRSFVIIAVFFGTIFAVLIAARIMCQ